MSSEQNSVSSILSQLRLFEWRFQIPINYTQSNLVTLSCISISVEEARRQIVSMLIKFENLAEEKSILEKDRKQQHNSQTYFNIEMNYYSKIKQMYQCNISYQQGCRDSSMEPYDYTRDMKVVNSHNYSYNQDLIRLEDLIKTGEITITNVNLISFHVSN